jgi:hypothetical protein
MQDPTTEQLPQIASMDVATLGGLIIVVTGVVEGIKHLFPTWAKGKEKFISLLLPYLVGIPMKLTVPGVYENMGWVPLLVALFFVGVASQSIHDRVLNALRKPKA